MSKIPPKLFETVKKDIQLSFHKKEILIKFVLFQIIGATFSLLVCPQFGLGFVRGHGVAHYFLQYGDWACAAFCGALFFGSGALVTFLGMKGEEIWWVWRRYKNQLYIAPAILWGLMMLLGPAVENAIYHSSWVITSVLILVGCMKLRELFFVQYQSLKV